MTADLAANVSEGFDYCPLRRINSHEIYADHNKWPFFSNEVQVIRIIMGNFAPGYQNFEQWMNFSNRFTEEIQLKHT